MAKNYCCNTESMAKEDIWRSFVDGQVFKCFWPQIVLLVSAANIHSKFFKSLVGRGRLQIYFEMFLVVDMSLCAIPTFLLFYVLATFFGWLCHSPRICALFRHIFYGFVTRHIFVPRRQDFVNMSGAHLFSINMHWLAAKTKCNDSPALKLCWAS